MEPNCSQKYFSESELVENLKSSGILKRKAEEQLFASYSYLISMGRTKYLISQEDSFNAYSDTVLAAIQTLSRGSFKGRSSFKTFIYEIFHNKCIDLLRKKGARKNSVHATIPLGGFENHLSDSSKSIIENLVSKSDLNKVKCKLALLGDSCQQLLLLSADGYSDKEIAEIMHFKTANVVKTTRLRCIKKLKQLLVSSEEGVFVY